MLKEGKILGEKEGETERRRQGGEGRKERREREEKEKGGNGEASGFVGFVEYHLENMDCVF